MGYLWYIFLAAVIWHVVDMIVCIISEVIFNRLRQTRWYKAVSFGKEYGKDEGTDGIENKIGFL